MGTFCGNIVLLATLMVADDPRLVLDEGMRVSYRFLRSALVRLWGGFGCCVRGGTKMWLSGGGGM